VNIDRPQRVAFRPERVTVTSPPGARDWVINDIKIGNISQISKWWHVRLWRRLTRRFRRPPIIRLIDGDKS
jgi:hypothetical protein